MTLNMKRNILNKFCFWVFVSLLTTISTSCKKMPLTNGDIIHETRQLSDFNAIHIYDNLDINLIKSDSCYIKITAGENLMPNIISEVVNNILTIRNDNTGNIFRDNESPLSADIYYKSDIYDIYYYSNGDLYSKDFINDDSLSVFNFELEEGSGNINLKLRCRKFNFTSWGGSCPIVFEGQCDTLNMYKKSYAPIHFEDMPCKISKIILLRGNDIYVDCHDSINAKIYDFGNIYYKGEPKINSYISPYAKGRIIKF